MYPFYKLIKPVLFALTILLSTANMFAQSCTPQGDEHTSGTNNVWIGYVYQGKNFNNYKGYVNYGTITNPSIDEGFGGNQATYITNGCSIYTDTFSVRFKLTKTFADSNYSFTVGADDGFRLSLDGGATWLINRWNDQGYTTEQRSVALTAGTYNLVLEFYENFGANRVTFDVVGICTGSGNTATYGASNNWIGYLYQGNNFEQYRGFINKGNGANMNFDENFGTTNGAFATSNCSITTENFSARFRSRTTLTGSYQFTVGGDDGYRLSLDGGATWIINEWQAQSYKVTSRTISNLNGTYDMVLEYYENGGDNRLSFAATQLTLLPVTITDWSARVINTNQVALNWKTADAVNFDHFVVQKSTDAQNFRDIAQVTAKTGNQVQSYTYTDQNVQGGKTWYRLAMVDKDGSKRYSTIVVVSIQQADAIRIYPTIVESKQVFIESNKRMGRVMIELVDMNGRIAQSEQRTLSAGRQTLGLNAAAAQKAGAYMIRMTGDDGVVTKQSIIIR
ncbi:T9SS C-terminal target domain-containing protein [Paraflavitalea soli]|uniref:T9SS C-terminal target domain-containing protein n=1 Tax=Paraflavitalea soli TaxID=2315862 RepID=A0A3B7MHZ2_9BACT|nr:PA14 domain-containing protein [Paraflavitalea soli]AXY72800.1 T9SS C-terminal target domain-containing protein [Paraflavitalea soli]